MAQMIDMLRRHDRFSYVNVRRHHILAFVYPKALIYTILV